MKLPFILFCLLALSLTPGTAALGQKTCSCKAKGPKAQKKSCEAAVTCKQRGCTAVCGPSDACYSACGKNRLITRFTLQLTTKNSQEVAAALSKKTGHKIEFKPFARMKEGPFVVNIQNDDMWAAMEGLYDRGVLTVDGVEWEKYRNLRQAAQADGRLSVSFNDILLDDALSHLTFLTGSKFTTGPAGAEKVVSVSMEEATVEEIIARLSEQTGVRVERSLKSASAR